MIDKLNGANPKKVSETVADRHFETVKKLTKSFMDSASGDYKECSPFAAYLAWVTQYIILCRYSQVEEKAEKSATSLRKEQEQKELKKNGVTKTMQGIQNENFLGYFQKELNHDIERFRTFQEMYTGLRSRVTAGQEQFSNFEKHYFHQLEQVSAQSKQYGY